MPAIEQVSKEAPGATAESRQLTHADIVAAQMVASQLMDSDRRANLLTILALVAALSCGFGLGLGIGMKIAENRAAVKAQQLESEIGQLREQLRIASEPRSTMVNMEVHIGTIVSVTGKRLTVSLPGGGDLECTLTKDASISIDDKAAGADKLRPGMMVHLFAYRDTPTAIVTVQATTPRD